MMKVFVYGCAACQAMEWRKTNESALNSLERWFSRCLPDRLEYERAEREARRRHEEEQAHALAEAERQREDGLRKLRNFRLNKLTFALILAYERGSNLFGLTDWKPKVMLPFGAYIV